MRDGNLPSIFDSAVRPAYRFLRDGTGYLAFERRFELDTMGRIPLEEFGLADSNRSPYRPSRWLTLPRILPRREVTSDDVFVDLGSGKGRVVFQAARLYPFERVIGVELVSQLSEIARGNIDRNRHRLACRDVELITSDALDYDVPDDVTVAYFGNPFVGDIFTAVIGKLLASVDRRPRHLRIVYSAPIEHRFLMQTGRMRVVRRLRGGRPGRDWSRTNATYLYEALPPAGWASA